MIDAALASAAALVKASPLRRFLEFLSIVLTVGQAFVWTSRRQQR
jgi:hypothetical protein